MKKALEEIEERLAKTKLNLDTINKKNYNVSQQQTLPQNVVIKPNPIPVVKTPSQPINQVQQIKPAQPNKPAQQNKPAQSIKPVQPIKQLQPIKPVQPTKQTQPIKQVLPIKQTQNIKAKKSVNLLNKNSNDAKGQNNKKKI